MTSMTMSALTLILALGYIVYMAMYLAFGVDDCNEDSSHNQSPSKNNPQSRGREASHEEVSSGEEALKEEKNHIDSFGGFDFKKKLQDTEAEARSSFNSLCSSSNAMDKKPITTMRYLPQSSRRGGPPFSSDEDEDDAASELTETNYFEFTEKN